MDFSSVERALLSLSRRQPTLSEDVVGTAKQLLSLWKGETTDFNENSELVAAALASLLSGTDDRWEPLAVGLFLVTSVLDASSSTTSKEKVYVEGPRVPHVKPSNETEAPSTATGTAAVASLLTSDTLQKLAAQLLAACQDHLTHKEPRVRTLVAKAVGIYLQFVFDLLKQANTEEGKNTITLELLQPALNLHDSIVMSLQDHLHTGRDEGNVEAFSHSSTGALDDTTGWRSLETNWQGLASYVSSMGARYFQYHGLSTEILDMCQHSCTIHVNRHVRAAGIATLEQWVLAAAAVEGGTAMILLQPTTGLWTTTVKVLQETLADNWSQVRMAASVLCRTFWMVLGQNADQLPSDWRSTLYTPLIPRMCLNRFYLAQGVKLYSHDTWKLIFRESGSGIAVVSETAGPVCRYYVKMCDADNHVVREAACQAVAELAVKLGTQDEYKESLAAYVPLLLQALLMCFHDESWPVRDEASLACGSFCKAFPEESRPELKTLMERWIEQLTDQIWSVRQDAAVALADAVIAYGDEVFDTLQAMLKEKIPSARKQPAMTMEEYKMRHNDIDSHTDSQLYSCGSLAPKLRKGGAGRIGCSSCGITRPKSPWEATDGCIYLLQELIAHCPNVTDDVWIPLAEELADVCRVKHFPQGDDLRATLWRQLPLIARSLGKQRFKRNYLQIFLDLLMSNLESRTASALSKHAAGQCADELAQLVGATIFRGRLDDFQQEAFDRAMRERKQMPKGPEADGFSPFGPTGLLDTSSPSQPLPAMSEVQGAFPPPIRTPVPGSGYADSL